MDDDLTTDENVSTGRNGAYERTKRRIIYLLLVYATGIGVLAAFYVDEPPQNQPFDFLVGLPLLVLGIGWCYADANERDFRIPVVTMAVLVVLFVVGFPLYVFQTRGVAGFKTLGLAVLLVGAMLAIMAVTGVATLYVREAIGGAAAAERARRTLIDFG